MWSNENNDKQKETKPNFFVGFSLLVSFRLLGRFLLPASVRCTALHRPLHCPPPVLCAAVVVPLHLFIATDAPLTAGPTAAASEPIRIRIALKRSEWRRRRSWCGESSMSPHHRQCHRQEHMHRWSGTTQRRAELRRDRDAEGAVAAVSLGLLSRCHCHRSPMDQIYICSVS